ncbi:hypothetical protein TWF281_011734 [Arthrobotrys megalospora]
MASIVTVGMIPEILYSILDCLPSRDVASLSRTCKDLYPACSHRFWSTLVLEDLSAKASVKFRDLVKGLRASRAEVSPLLKSTRTLVLGHYVLNVRTVRQPDHSYKVEEVEPEVVLFLTELLEGNELDLRHVKITLGENELTGSQQRLLISLKEYSQSRSQGDIRSLHISAKDTCSFDKFFHLEIITKLELHMWLGPRPPSPRDRYRTRRQIPWTARPENIPAAILELADLLASLPKIQFFSWASSSTRPLPNLKSEILSRSVARLQTVLTNLKSLRELRVRGKLFCSSYFLHPPRTLRKLVIGKKIKITVFNSWLKQEYEPDETWWRQFSSCSLPLLEKLEIYSNNSPNFENPILLENTAISGVKTLRIIGYPLPVDLRDCIYRGNDKYSLRHLALKVTAEERAESIIQSFHAIIRKDARCALLTTTTKLLPWCTCAFAGVEEGLINLVTQHFTSSVIDAQQRADTVNLASLEQICENINETAVGAQTQLEILLRDCINVSGNEARGNHGLTTDMDMIKACLDRFPEKYGTFLDWLEGIEELERPYDNITVEYLNDILGECIEVVKDEYLDSYLSNAFTQIPQAEFKEKCLAIFLHWERSKSLRGWSHLKKSLKKQARKCYGVVEELLEEPENDKTRSTKYFLVQDILNNMEEKDDYFSVFREPWAKGQLSAFRARVGV